MTLRLHKWVWNHVTSPIHILGNRTYFLSSEWKDYQFTWIIYIIVRIVHSLWTCFPETSNFFFFLLSPSLPSFVFFSFLLLSLPPTSHCFSPLSLRWWVKLHGDYNKNASPPLQLGYSTYFMGFPAGSVIENPLPMQESQEMWAWSLGREERSKKKWKLTPVFWLG